MARRWVDLEITLLSELTLTWQDKYLVCVSLMWTLAFNFAFWMWLWITKLERILETGRVCFKESGGRRWEKNAYDTKAEKSQLGVKEKWKK